MRSTVMAAAVALALGGGTAWAQSTVLNDAGIVGAQQTARGTGNINQTESTSQSASNGAMTNTAGDMNGVQANDQSTANQLINTNGGDVSANWGKLGSFNTRIVAVQRLESSTSKNEVRGIGNVALSASVGGFGARGGRGGNAEGGNAIGVNAAVGLARGGNATNLAGEATGPDAADSTNGNITYNPDVQNQVGNRAGGGNGIAGGVGVGVGGDGGDAGSGATAVGGAGAAGQGAAGTTSSGGQSQRATASNSDDQSAHNNSGQIAGNAKGDSGNARASADAGHLKVAAGDAIGGDAGHQGGDGGRASNAKSTAGAFEMANQITSAFSNGAGVMQSSMNSAITGSVMQGVNIQANVGVSLR